MREFKSIEGIREATVEQLSQVDTISEKWQRTYTNFSLINIYKKKAVMLK